MLLVKNVGGVYLGCHATREIFDALATIAPFDGGIVAMSFGVGLFQQWQPRLVGVFTLCKVL